MTIQQIDPKLIDPNPYQPLGRRTFKPADLEDLVSIGDPDVGLLQIPAIRRNPANLDRYQRVEGHRRQAAWQLWHPGEAMPNDVQALTDRQMYEHMAIENAARVDLTPIQKAKLIQNYIDEFGANQLEAGKLVGIHSQGGVSNLLSLLALPAGIQILVADGRLPERFGRGLRKLAAVNSGAAIKIADKVAAAPEEKRDDVEGEALRDFLRTHKNAIDLRDDTPWPLEWPAKPIAVGDKTIGEIPACTGCKFNLERDRDHYCLRPACHTLKGYLFAKHQVKIVAKKLGLTPGAVGEKAKVIFNGNSGGDLFDSDRAQKAIKSKHASLRIVPHVSTSKYSSYDYGRNSRTTLLGTSVVDLATTDRAALQMALSKIKEPQTAKPKFSASAWQKRENAARAKRTAIAKANRSLIDAALPYLLPAFALNPRLIDLLWNYQFVERSRWVKLAAADKPRELLRGVLNDKFNGNFYSPAKPASVQANLQKLSADMKIKLPHNWDRPLPRRKRSQRRRPNAVKIVSPKPSAK